MVTWLAARGISQRYLLTITTVSSARSLTFSTRRCATPASASITGRALHTTRTQPMKTFKFSITLSKRRNRDTHGCLRRSLHALFPDQSFSHLSQSMEFQCVTAISKQFSRQSQSAAPLSQSSSKTFQSEMKTLNTFSQSVLHTR